MFSSFVFSLCKKTPNIALCSFLKQSFTLSKLLGFKNFACLIFDVFLSKTKNSSVFLLALFNIPVVLYYKKNNDNDLQGALSNF